MLLSPEKYIYNEYIVHKLKNEKAINYILLELVDNKSMGVFLNNKGEIIGINTYHTEDIYSGRNIQVILEKKLGKSKLDLNTNKENSDVTWWNMKCYKIDKEEDNLFEDINIATKDLKKYFNEIIEVQEEHKLYKTTWHTYYINPPLGLSVKVNDTIIDYTSQKIKEILLFEDKHGQKEKIITLKDKNNIWVEDIDITTNQPWENIEFIFEKYELKASSTKDNEQQAYVELYEKINPYNTPEENRKELTKWLKRNKKIINTENFE